MNQSFKSILLWTSLPLVGLSGMLLAGESDPPTKARGEGSITFAVEEHEKQVFDDDDKPGRGYLLFQVERKPQGIVGSLLFGAEQHHGMLYPEVIVRVSNIQEVSFGQHHVEFSGKGKLHDDPVEVRVVARDGTHRDEHDHFSIKCRNPKGEVVFHASGELFAGDIKVGEDQ